MTVSPAEMYFASVHILACEGGAGVASVIFFSVRVLIATCSLQNNQLQRASITQLVECRSHIKL